MAVDRSAGTCSTSLTTARRMPGVHMRGWSLTSMATAGKTIIKQALPRYNSHAAQICALPREKGLGLVGVSQTIHVQYGQLMVGVQS